MFVHSEISAPKGIRKTTILRIGLMYFFCKSVENPKPSKVIKSMQW